MNNATRSRTFSKRLALVTVSALVFGFTQADPARADSVVAEISNSLPVFEVIGNGSDYTQLTGAAPSGLAFSVVADAEIGGQVRSVSYSAAGSVTGAFPGPYELPTHNDSRSFSGFFHRKETLVGNYPIEAADLVAACNYQAASLRALGYGNDEVFGEDRQLTLTVNVMPDASFSLASPFMDQVPDSESTQVICRKWSGMVGFSPPAQIAAEEGVIDSSLTLIEQYGQSGLCKVVLSGVVRSTSANMEVKFRYEHHDGKKSDVKTVTTDASKTAFFSHDYAIPNEPGPEGGSIRIVGVSPSFTSDSEAYSMNCSEPGATGFQVSKLPTLELGAMPGGSVQIGSQVCPTELRLRGTITAQGGGSFGGQAFFVGPGYASAHHPWEVSNSQVAVVEDVMPLEWDTDFGLMLEGGDGDAPLKTQTVVAGFNVMGSDNTEIANVPQKSFNVGCRRLPGPAMQGGGFTAGAGGDTPTKPAASPLLAQPAINGNAPTGTLPGRTTPAAGQQQTLQAPAAAPAPSSLPATRRTLPRASSAESRAAETAREKEQRPRRR